MAEARTPDYIRKMPQYQRTQQAAEEASLQSRAAVEVTDEASCAQAAEILGRVATVVKAGNKDRLAATQPYRDSTSLINRLFGEMLAPLEGAEERLREEVATFERKKRIEEDEAKKAHEKAVAEHEAAVKKAADDAIAKREAEEEKARQAEKAGQPAPEPPAAEPEPAPLPPPPPPPPPPAARSGRRATSTGSVKTDTVWKFELVDIAFVPSDLTILNEPEVRKRIAEGAREIKGLRIYPDERTTVR